MPDLRPLSERCSLMAKPGDPPPPKERPSYCPKDAAYVVGGGTANIVNISPDIPIIFEGGDGDDVVNVVGERKGVVVLGGAGDDRLTVGDERFGSSPEGRKLVAEIGGKLAVGSGGRELPVAPRAGEPGLGGAGMLVALAMIFAALTAIAWRALAPRA